MTDRRQYLREKQARYRAQPDNRERINRQKRERWLTYGPVVNARRRAKRGEAND